MCAAAQSAQRGNGLSRKPHSMSQHEQMQFRKPLGKISAPKCVLTLVGA